MRIEGGDWEAAKWAENDLKNVGADSHCCFACILTFSRFTESKKEKEKRKRKKNEEESSYIEFYETFAVPQYIF